VSENVRRLEVWTATHDTGWVTQAVENPDGTYAAWALPTAAVVSDPDYVERDAENARRAAEFALARKTGHRTCSAACSGWALHTDTH
jgi:uncharacterized ferredoxin-like protein